MILIHISEIKLNRERINRLWILENQSIISDIEFCSTRKFSCLFRFIYFFFSGHRYNTHARHSHIHAPVCRWCRFVISRALRADFQQASTTPADDDSVKAVAWLHAAFPSVSCRDEKASGSRGSRAEALWRSTPWPCRPPDVPGIWINYLF